MKVFSTVSSHGNHATQSGLARLCCVLLLIPLLFCQVSNAESIDDLLNPPKMNVTRPVPQSESATPFRGQFRSVNYAVLSAGIAGKVKSFPIKTGSRVKKGQTIAEFDCSVARVERKINLAREQAVAENLKVNQRLNALKNISELELNMSVAELAIAQAELERTDKVLKDCVITAPFSGTVTEKMVQAFEYVDIGDPLIELIDTENMEIEMVLPSLQLNQYQAGAPFSMSVDETGSVVKAVVERVVNVIDPVSQTVRIIGSIDGPADDVMPGMSGRIIFEP